MNWDHINIGFNITSNLLAIVLSLYAIYHVRMGIKNDLKKLGK